MALCLACGNSIDNTTSCSKCGGTELRGLDRLVAGTSSISDARTVTGDWDKAAVGLGAPPSKGSLREVKREAKKRKRRKRLHWWFN